jgi:1-acyl-sn-glycerol-3-phosphate acyltransferase
MYGVIRILCRAALLFAGQWIQVTGERPDPVKGPYLYLFNHESMLDQFIVAAAIPEFINGIGALKQFSYPLWGLIIKRYGVIPIKRRDLKEAIKSLDLVAEEIGNGVSFFIAPEGTRTVTGELGVFKKGPFHLALNTGVTIAPIILINAFEAKPKTDWRIKPGKIIVHFDKVITGADYEEKTMLELRAYVKERMQTVKNKYSEKI